MLSGRACADSATRLRALVAAPDITCVPGVYDAMSASLAESAGFAAAFVSGSALAMTQLGRPDIGLLGASETADAVARIADRVDIPLFVDADHGFGNAFAVARSVRMLERAGAAGIQIEDQLEVKPSSAPLSRPVIPLAAMLDKIAAAQDARHNEQTIISARTDAMTNCGFEEACCRAEAFADAKADLVFVESLTTRADMERLVSRMAGRAPLLHNLLRSGDEVSDANTLQELGYKVALFPSVAVSAVSDALESAFASLQRRPASTQSAPDRIAAAEFIATGMPKRING